MAMMWVSETEEGAEERMLEAHALSCHSLALPTGTLFRVLRLFWFPFLLLFR